LRRMLNVRDWVADDAVRRELLSANLSTG
jgi:hypothetical protein